MNQLAEVDADAVTPDHVLVLQADNIFGVAQFRAGHKGPKQLLRDEIAVVVRAGPPARPDEPWREAHQLDGLRVLGAYDGLGCRAAEAAASASSAAATRPAGPAGRAERTCLWSKGAHSTGPTATGPAGRAERTW